MAYRKPYTELPRKQAEGKVSDALRFGWGVAHPKTGDPVKEAERALRIRLWLMAVIVFLATTAVATAFISFTIDFSCLVVSILAALTIWPVVCIRMSIRASGADEFWDKHDGMKFELTRRQNRDSKPAFEGEATRIINNLGCAIARFEKDLEPKAEIDKAREAMQRCYDRYREFNLVDSGGIEPFIPKPVEKKKPAQTAEPPQVTEPELITQSV